MPKIYHIILLLLFVSNLFAIDINDSSTDIDLLSHSEIFLDYDKNVDTGPIEPKAFTQNTSPVLGMGFIPDATLWIRFSIKNTSNKKVHKTIVYENPETENIRFFDADKVVLEGMWNMQDSRESIYPHFHISLDAHEQRTYYIRAYSQITTLIAKLRLYKEDDAYKSRLHTQDIPLYVLRIYIYIAYLQHDAALFYKG